MLRKKDINAMKTRIISAVIGLVLLFAVVLSGKYLLGIGIFILALIGVHEFYNAIGKAGYKPVRIIGYISCLPILFIGMGVTSAKVYSYISLFKSINYFSLGMYAALVFLFAMTIFLHDRYNIADIALTLFGAFYVAFLFSFVPLTRNLPNGSYFIWMVFIGAFVTDTFAYFTGVFFGKTKFLPAISANKTLEGSIGGIIGCTVMMVLYGMFINSYSPVNPDIPLYHFAILGLLSGVLSQIGDWSASAIKRYVKIKDYGKIMPGHGGVLDRFDSILFIAPVVYFYLSFVILA